MGGTRNNQQLGFGNVGIQPAVTTVPNGTSTTDLVTTSGGSTSNVASITTTANVTSTGTGAQTILSPVTALQGSSRPFVLAPLFMFPRSNVIKQLTSGDLQEETLRLDTYNFANGQATQDVSTIRCDVISLIKYSPVYDNTGLHLSTFGQYFDDLYQSSLVRDTVRKYVLVNAASVSPEINAILSTISARVSTDINNAKTALGSLDSLIQKIKELNSVLDPKQQLDTAFVFTTPMLGLKTFFTQRMLFAEQSYSIFANTKILYQLLFDLSGMLQKCSFNLLQNFNDSDRTAYVSNPRAIRKQTVQDAITLDLTYGSNLNYSPEAIKNKFVLDYVTFNGILNALPAESTNRFKFVLNLLSKEFKVSKGLGKYSIPEASYFGFQTRGNPFDNVIGGVPSDIFSPPTGQNSLSTLMYVKVGSQNVVVLPYETRQVVGDNETVFVPGSSYFSDKILRNDFSTFYNYKDTFSTRITKAKNVFDKLLLRQTSSDPTSAPLEPIEMLKSVLQLYADSQNQIRTHNNESTNTLSFVLMLIANSDPKIKFELYKLLLLLVVYDTRRTVTGDVNQTDKFRDFLMFELSSQVVQGFTQAITEDNISELLDTQIEFVKQQLLANITPAGEAVNGLEPNRSKEAALLSQQEEIGFNVPSPTRQTRNPAVNLATFQIQQFSRLIYAFRGEQNLLKSILDFAKKLFTAAIDGDRTYHIIDGSTVTRYNNVSVTGFILLCFELFSGLVDQFAKPNLSFSIVDGAGQRSENSQYVQVGFIGKELAGIGNDISKFVHGSTYNNSIINDYATKLGQEEQIISNAIMFFDRINQQLGNVVAPSITETNMLGLMGTNNPSILSTTRTAKGIMQGIVNKQSVYNPTNNAALNFYLPAGKVVSANNWTALQTSLAQGMFLGDRKHLVTVGIPSGFVNAALGARLTKKDVYTGKLDDSTSDLIDIFVYKLDKNDEGVIYKPKRFRFDLSLFARGFDAYSAQDLVAMETYDKLLDNFQFYDFDEDQPFSNVTAKTISQFVSYDPYYSLTPQRKAIGAEVGKNLFNSFLLDLYMHMVSGLNASEETFIKYTEQETNRFANEMAKLSNSSADLSKLKLMSTEYSALLNVFRNNPDDVKLMLTLCNDIPSAVFREKQYDRVFNLLFDVDDFPIDRVAMSRSVEGKILLELLHQNNRLSENPLNNETYKLPDEFTIDQYFINVELVR